MDTPGRIGGSKLSSESFRTENCLINPSLPIASIGGLRPAPSSVTGIARRFCLARPFRLAPAKRFGKWSRVHRR
jgi:hypothetical protein